MHVAKAREFSLMARRLEELPLLTEAAQEGSISWSALREVLRRAYGAGKYSCGLRQLPPQHPSRIFAGLGNGSRGADLARRGRAGFGQIASVGRQPLARRVVELRLRNSTEWTNGFQKRAKVPMLFHCLPHPLRCRLCRQWPGLADLYKSLHEKFGPALDTCPSSECR